MAVDKTLKILVQSKYNSDKFFMTYHMLGKWSSKKIANWLAEKNEKDKELFYSL